jgi:colicin import membrane protein
MAKKELAVIKLDQFSIQQLPELKNKKEEVAEKISTFKYVEIKDNSSYEEAKKVRTGVRTIRTDLQKEQKAVDKKIKDFILVPVKDAYEEIINEVIVVENIQQEEVSRWEDIKEQERLEKQRIEQERISNIKNYIEEFERKAYEIIDSSTIENVNENKAILDNLVNAEFDFQEFLVAFEQARVRVQYRFDIKCDEIQQKENQRLENERLAKEKAEAHEKLRKIQEQQEKERLEREEKARQEQLQMLEIRKNRLAEIGIALNGGIVFQHLEFPNVYIDYSKFMSCNMLEFENLIADAKEMIKKESEAKKEVVEVIDENKTTSMLPVDYEIGKSNAIQQSMQIDAKIAFNSLPKVAENSWEYIHDLFIKESEADNFYYWLKENYNVPTKK